jgi:anti-sigma regulatory factor (Ser/Thr protein kinase)
LGINYKTEETPEKLEQFELELEAKLENLARIGDFIDEIARQLGLAEREIFDIRMAVDEACTNIIEHGYSDGGGGLIRIHCQRIKDDFIVTIEDYGRAFDPEAVPPPDLKADLKKRRVGGLGLHFMRELMDEVKFSFDAVKGNRLVMVKHLQKDRET